MWNIGFKRSGCLRVLRNLFFNGLKNGFFFCVQDIIITVMGIILCQILVLPPTLRKHDCRSISIHFLNDTINFNNSCFIAFLFHWINRIRRNPIIRLLIGFFYSCSIWFSKQEISKCCANFTPTCRGQQNNGNQNRCHTCLNCFHIILHNFLSPLHYTPCVQTTYC